MKLRDYQEHAVLKASTMLASGKRKIIFHLPTGAGKTVCFSAISKRYIDKTNKSVLILVHRTELLNQTRRTLYNSFNISAQVVIAGMKVIPNAKVYVGMVESVNRRIDKIKNIGLVILDEAHLANFFKIHKHFEHQFMIGFTATPLSANKKNPLNKYYENIVCSIQIPELIKSGSLCQNITYAPKDTIDRHSLKIKGDDFDDGLMALEFSKPKHIQNTVAAYSRYCPGTKAIVFNVNIEHSKLVNQAFLDTGITSKHVDGNMSSEERKCILKWFEETPGSVLNNVGIATTGTDIPSIETVIVNKGTMSMPLLSQMMGRGSRPTHEKSMFFIIDMGGNVLVHGDYDSDRDWENIFFNPPKVGKPGAAPVKNCPQCDAILPARVRECKYCGHVFPPEEIEEAERLSDFVIVTKGIDVPSLIEENRQKKEYYPFFLIGKELAFAAKKTIPEMTDENFKFILQNYFTLAGEWCKAKEKKFNQWHKQRAEETLITELQSYFKKWQPSPSTKTSTM